MTDTSTETEERAGVGNAGERLGAAAAREKARYAGGEERPLGSYALTAADFLQFAYPGAGKIES